MSHYWAGESRGALRNVVHWPSAQEMVILLFLKERQRNTIIGQALEIGIKNLRGYLLG